MAEKTTTPKANGMTKMDGVKQALATLGPKAKPAQIKDYLESQLGLEISLGVANSYKKEWARRARAAAQTKPAAAKPAAKPAAQPKAQKKAAPAPAAAPTRPASPPRPAAAPKPAAGGIDLKDIAATKDLVDRVGADRLRGLIDVLAR